MIGRKGKMLCLILSLLLMLSIFAGCGGSSDKATDPPAEGTKAPEGTTTPVDETETPAAEGISFPLAEPVELTIALPLAPFANALITELNDWVMFQEMEKITNVHWEGELHPALNATETFSMMITSGEWPDVMANLDMVTKNGNFQSYQDEIIIELSDLVAEYAPNIQAQIDADDDLLLNLTYEGESGENLLLNFPMINEIASPNQESGLQYRGDWLDELGLDVPETISEFETVLEAFKTNYDSMYYIGNQPDALPIVNPLNVKANYDEIAQEGVAFPLYVKDGEVRCGLLDDQLLDYFTTANEWYKAGYIDPEFYSGISQNIDAETARVENGEFGSYLAGLSTYSMINETFAASGSDAYMVAGPHLVNDNRDETHLSVTKNKLRNRCWTISTLCEEPELVTAWIDYLFSDEGYILYNYGVQGEHFEYNEAGEPVLTDFILKNPDELPTIMTEYVYTNNEASHVPGKLLISKNLVGYDDETLAARDTWLDSIGGSDWVLSRAVTLNNEENEIYSGIFGDILTYFQEMNLSFVTGAKSLDEFDAYRDRLVELGMDTVVELYQAAYDRYAARVAGI